MQLTIEEHYVSLFFPQLLNGRTIWNPQTHQQIGQRGIYNPFTNQLSLFDIDISSYEVSRYPTLSQEVVLQSLPTGGDFFKGGSLSEYAMGVKVDTPEVVYLVQNVEDEVFYVPGLRFAVNAGDVFNQVDALYQKLVAF